MPFCSKCGTEVPETVNFCSKCGFALQNAQVNQATPTPVANTGVESTSLLDKSFSGIGSNAIQNLKDLSDKWVWTLACVPIFGMILESIFLSVTGYRAEYTGTVIFVILNIIFVSLDMKELDNKDFNPDSWLWLGIILIPIYLFVRASKTNRKYGYAITWCILFVLSLIIQGESL